MCKTTSKRTPTNARTRAASAIGPSLRKVTEIGTKRNNLVKVSEIRFPIPINFGKDGGSGHQSASRNSIEKDSLLF